MDWASICMPRREGGLGFRPIKVMNLSLMVKWLWRIREGGDSLWKQVLVVKYKVLRDGWKIQSPNYRSSNLWTGILSARESFSEAIGYSVGTKEKILFWLESWVGERPLAVEFPLLFLCYR